GWRSDDLATELGHEAVLPVLAPQGYAHTPQEVPRMREDCETRVPDHVLRIRSGAVMLSLIAGADQEQGLSRLRLATEWARASVRTRRGAGTILRDLSSTSRDPLIELGQDGGVGRTTDRED